MFLKTENQLINTDAVACATISWSLPLDEISTEPGTGGVVKQKAILEVQFIGGAKMVFGNKDAKAVWKRLTKTARAVQP